MQCIKILGTPSGEPPLWIRKAWIPLILPLDPHFPESNAGVNIPSKTPMSNYGYNVDAVLAVEILSLHNPDAALWWRENTTLIQPGNHLVFSADDEIELTRDAPSIAPPKGKSDSGITIGRFLERVNEIVPTPVPFWAIHETFRPPVLKEIIQYPMTRPAALILSSIAAAEFTRYLHYGSTEETFTEIHKEGHDFLRAFYRIAIECGINVTLEEIDRPLSYTDFAVWDGTAEMRDGMVRLTEKGERLVEDVKRRESAPNN